MTIEQIYDQIIGYAHDRIGGIGGYWGQEPYKMDFFQIFYNAYYNGWCGGTPFLNARRSRKRIDFRRVIINGEFLRQFLQEKWLNGKEPQEQEKAMIDDLCRWWDEWTYAWALHPRKLPRRYFPRRSLA
jgi:hypothetical protein